MSTGGPAFPWNGDMDRDLRECAGMTLRDYFAAKAMQGLLANSFLTQRYTERHGDLRLSMNGTAVECYVLADAMLKEREK